MRSTGGNCHAFQDLIMRAPVLYFQVRADQGAIGLQRKVKKELDRPHILVMELLPGKYPHAAATVARNYYWY